MSQSDKDEKREAAILKSIVDAVKPVKKCSKAYRNKKGATPQERKKLAQQAKKKLMDAANRTLLRNGDGKSLTLCGPAFRDMPTVQRVEVNKRGRYAITGAVNAQACVEFKYLASRIVHEAGLPMLTNMLYDSYENRDFRLTMDIVQFLAAYAYGKPREMKDFDNNGNDVSEPARSPPSTQIVVPIQVVSSTAREDEIANSDIVSTV